MDLLIKEKIELKSQLENTILPFVLVNIILKYTETSIFLEIFNSEGSSRRYFNQVEFENLDCKDVTKVDIYGVLVLKNPKEKFKKSKIQQIIGNVVLIGNASFMFNNATNFNSDISGWDVSNVTIMSYMFNNATNFNSDISGWDVSNVNRMGGMFMGAESFNSDLSNWNVSKVIFMSNMFRGALSFNSDLSSWDTSKVKNMNNMFRDATNFNADINSWDTSKVIPALKYVYG
jgi:surface protein